MKVLMIARETLYSSPGGDTIQIVNTAKFLNKLNVSVDIGLSNSQYHYSNYDLLHFFNIIRPDDILPHINHSTPYVVSTIFVDYTEYEKARGGKIGLLNNFFGSDGIEYLKALARFVINGTKIQSKFYLLRGHRKAVERVAKGARLLLPNSDSEYRRFESKYGLQIPYLKVPNAIDLSIFSDLVKPDPAFNDHIICVGRIEGRKNQLNLIKALTDTEFCLTIIGQPSPNHLGYFNECKRLVDENTNMRILEHADHNKLAGIFKAAKVHVLPSWFETTGLSSLEAAVMGCNIVVSKKGDTEEYFENYAFYCEPSDISSIKTAVEQAFFKERSFEFKKVIIKNYTWNETALATLKGYNIALNII